MRKRKVVLDYTGVNDDEFKAPLDLSQQMRMFFHLKLNIVVMIS